MPEANNDLAIINTFGDIEKRLSFHKFLFVDATGKRRRALLWNELFSFIKIDKYNENSCWQLEACSFVSIFSGGSAVACQCLINRIYFGYSFPKRESSSKLYLIKLVKDDARIHQSKMKSRKKYDELYIILRYNRSCNHTENKLVFRISTVSSRYIIYTHIYI